MRISINLASRPYQDEGQFYRRWGGALALMIVLTALMVFVSVRHYQNTKREWASARAAEQKLTELKREDSQAQEVLSRPENRGTRDRSQFLNTAIVRKSFSWTHLMEDLEQVLPYGLRVTNIAPQLDRNNRFTLKIEVQGATREPAVELVRNMEKSKNFRATEIVREQRSESNQGEGGVKSEIISSYTPAEPLEGAAR